MNSNRVQQKSSYFQKSEKNTKKISDFEQFQGQSNQFFLLIDRAIFILFLWKLNDRGENCEYF